MIGGVLADPSSWAAQTSIKLAKAKLQIILHCTVQSDSAGSQHTGICCMTASKYLEVTLHDPDVHDDAAATAYMSHSRVLIVIEQQPQLC